jgi:hypothetical protein
VTAVRWDDLFADLEGQLAAEDDRRWQADVEELARAERGAVRLADRLRAHEGDLGVRLVDGATHVGPVLEVGDGWVLLGTVRGELLVPLASVGSVTGLGHRSAVEPASAVRRLGLTAVLRGLVRRRRPVEVVTPGAGLLAGTLDAVAADHVELAVHPLDEPRRAANIVAVQVIPIGAIVSLRSG